MLPLTVRVVLMSQEAVGTVGFIHHLCHIFGQYLLRCFLEKTVINTGCRGECNVFCLNGAFLEVQSRC